MHYAPIRAQLTSKLDFALSSFMIPKAMEQALRNYLAYLRDTYHCTGGGYVEKEGVIMHDSDNRAKRTPTHYMLQSGAGRYDLKQVVGITYVAPHDRPVISPARREWLGQIKSSYGMINVIISVEDFARAYESNRVSDDPDFVASLGYLFPE